MDSYFMLYAGKEHLLQQGCCEGKWQQYGHDVHVTVIQKIRGKKQAKGRTDHQYSLWSLNDGHKVHRGTQTCSDSSAALASL